MEIESEEKQREREPNNNISFVLFVKCLFRSVFLCMLIFASIYHLNYLRLLLFFFWWTGSSDTGQSDVEERVTVSFNFRENEMGGEDKGVASVIRA